MSVNGFSIFVKDIQALEDTHAPVTIQFIALGRKYLYMQFPAKIQTFRTLIFQFAADYLKNLIEQIITME